MWSARGARGCRERVKETRGREARQPAMWRVCVCFGLLTDLLLIVKEDRCYYYQVPEHRKPYLDNEYYKDLMERELETMLTHTGSNHHIQTNQASLQEVLNKFRDRLADFRCTNKNTYILSIQDTFYDHIIQLVG